MTATFAETNTGTGGTGGPETDAAALAALAAHQATQPAHGSDLAGASRPPTAHGHPQADITGLAAALGAKQDAASATTDTELSAAVAGLVPNTDPRLSDARVPTAHTHPWADLTSVPALIVEGDARLSDARAPTAHDHDARYYTEAEVDALLAGVGGGAGNAAAWQAFPWATDQYVTPYGGSTTGSPADGQLQCTPLWVPEGGQFTRVGFDVTVAGTAGAVVRTGIYESTVNGRPGDLLTDFGALDATTIGVKLLDMTAAPFVFPAPGLYWLAAAVQGAAVTRPTVRVGNGIVWPNPFYNASNTQQSSVVAFVQNSVAGAFPSPFVMLTTSNTAIRVLGVAA